LPRRHLDRDIAQIPRKGLRPEEQEDKNAGKESAQVPPIGHPIPRAGQVNVDGRLDLDHQVIHQDPEGADFGPGGNNGDNPQSADAPSGEKQQVGAGNPKNCAAGPNTGNLRFRLGQSNRQASQATREQVIKQEAARPAGIFHPAAKDP